MTHDTSKSTTHAAGGATHHLRRSWTIAAVVAVIMAVLAMVGVALTTTVSASTAETYWVALVPVFGLLCIVTAWLRSGPGHPVDSRAVLRQVFHWAGIGVAMYLDFFILRTGEETRTATGMNAVLLLALGCYLAGIHLEWMFVPVGVLLSLTLTLVGKIDQYQWLIFVIGGATVVFILAMRWFLAARHVHIKVPPAAPSAP